jgi:hypothetical protein
MKKSLPLQIAAGKRPRPVWAAERSSCRILQTSASVDSQPPNLFTLISSFQILVRKVILDRCDHHGTPQLRCSNGWILYFPSISVLLAGGSLPSCCKLIAYGTALPPISGARFVIPASSTACHNRNAIAEVARKPECAPGASDASTCRRRKCCRV